MNKLELAHDYVMNYLSNPECEACTVSGIVSVAWEYADLMFKQEEKRKDKSRPEVLEGWQPDWSQAPDGFDWFCVGGCSGLGFFCNIEPKIFKDHYWFTGEDAKQVNCHGYKGDWKDSLRKRP